jgi:hypothetical protein
LENLMPCELPIACSLNPSELPARLAEMADLGRGALIDARIEPTRAQLRFAAGSGVRARVEAIVAVESQCCPFLTMRVSDESDTVVLTLDGPEDAELVLAELLDAFYTERQVRLMSTGRWAGRRTDAALVGGGVLVVLCCAVGPAVIGAVAGSATGGWLGIACAIVLAAIVGLMLHRRAGARGC